MKNTIAIAALIAVLTILVPLGSMAQSEVMYPVDKYLNWEMRVERDTVVFRNRTAPLPFCGFGDSDWRIDSVLCQSRLKMSFSDPFHYRAADSNTTHTLYGVAIPLMGGPLDNGECDTLLDFSFPFDIAVYTGHVDDTTVNLVTRQSFYFDSGRVPDLWMRFPNSFAIPMYEYYFSQPITLTGLFFVGAGCSKGELVPKRVSIGTAFVGGAIFNRTYAGVAICDDSLVQDYFLECVYCENGARAGYYYTGRTSDFRWGYPGRQSVPIPDVEQRIWWWSPGYAYMWTTQSYYPILQPRNTGVEEVAKPETLRLMPNPASERVTLVADRPIRNYRIVDMTGRTVLSGTPLATATTMTLNIRTLPRGIYCVQVETANGHHTQKLSVQ